MAKSEVVHKGDGFDILLADRDDVAGSAESIRGYVEHCTKFGKVPCITELCEMYGGILCGQRIYEHMPLEHIIVGAVQLGYGFAVWEADQKEQAQVAEMLDDMAPKESEESSREG